jgi:hypothetical protein
MFPMAAMQEPPKGARANCTFKTFRQPNAVGLSGSRPVTLVAIYTAEPISGDSELFVHYGNEKKRDYVVGEPSRPLALKDIRDDELPRCFVFDASRFIRLALSNPLAIDGTRDQSFISATEIPTTPFSISSSL